VILITSIRPKVQPTKNKFFEGLFSWSHACLYLTLSVISIYLKYVFRWSLSTYLLWLRVCGNILSEIQHYLSIYIEILTNIARELMPYISEFNSHTNSIRKYFIYTKILFETGYNKRQCFTLYVLPIYVLSNNISFF
jgi:hypothetical protein